MSLALASLARLQLFPRLSGSLSECYFSQPMSLKLKFQNFSCDQNVYIYLCLCYILHGGYIFSTYCLIDTSAPISPVVPLHNIYLDLHSYDGFAVGLLSQSVMYFPFTSGSLSAYISCEIP